MNHSQSTEKAMDADRHERAMFVMAMRLRKCRRCGHYPCPCCEMWCDVFTGADYLDPPLIQPQGFNMPEELWVALVGVVKASHHYDERVERSCPCAEEGACVYTPKDLDHNRQIFADIEKICKTYNIKADGFGAVEDKYGEHVVVYGKPFDPPSSPPTDEKAARAAIDGAIDGVVAGVRQWSPDDRLKLMNALGHAFCIGCGWEEPEGGPYCQCRNDE